MAIRVFSDGYLVLETAEDSLRSSQDFVGLLKQRICEEHNVAIHRQKLTLGRSELTEGRTWRSLGSPLEVSMELQPDDEFAQGDELLRGCQCGHEQRVRRLLHKGQNPNLCRKGQPRPLDLAIDSGHLGTVKALLEVKAHLTAESLHLAVGRGNVEVLRELLGHRAQLDALRRTGPYAGMTPLHQACSLGFCEVVRLLLSAKANVNAQSATGETALHLVSTYDTAVAVVQAGADPSIVDNINVMPEYRVMENGFEEAARGLFGIEKGGVEYKQMCDMSRTIYGRDLSSMDRSLRLAVWSHHPADVLEKWIKAGARVDHDNHFGYTPLHMAAHCNNHEGARTLLRNKANPNRLTRDGHGATALHFAVKWPDPDFVQVFLEGSADISKVNVKKETVLHLACFSGNVDMVRSLIFCRVPLGAQDQLGATPLHAALTSPESNNVVEITQLLLIANAPVDLYAKDGSAPFHVAAKSGQIGAVKSLLMAFARLDQCHRNSGDFALHLAATAGHVDVVKTLLEAMMAPSVQNKEGDSPLHMAVGNGHNDVARCLLVARASLGLENGNKDTPLAVASAIHGPHSEVVQTLRAHLFALPK